MEFLEFLYRLRTDTNSNLIEAIGLGYSSVFESKVDIEKYSLANKKFDEIFPKILDFYINLLGKDLSNEKSVVIGYLDNIATMPNLKIPIILETDISDTHFYSTVTKKIHIFITTPFKHGIFDEFKHLTSKLNKNNPEYKNLFRMVIAKGIKPALNNDTRSSFVHEVIHAIDDYRNPKIFTDKKSLNYEQLDKKRHYDEKSNEFIDIELEKGITLGSIKNMMNAIIHHDDNMEEVIKLEKFHLDKDVMEELKKRAKFVINRLDVKYGNEVNDSGVPDYFSVRELENAIGYLLHGPNYKMPDKVSKNTTGNINRYYDLPSGIREELSEDYVGKSFKEIINTDRVKRYLSQLPENIKSIALNRISYLVKENENEAMRRQIYFNLPSEMNAFILGELSGYDADKSFNEIIHTKKIGSYLRHLSPDNKKRALKRIYSIVSDKLDDRSATA